MESAMRIMHPILALIILSGMNVCAKAEEKNDASRKIKGQVYVFYGGGIYQHVKITNLSCIQLGGGGEALLYKGLGIGAELSSVQMTQRFASTGLDFGNGTGLFSLDGAYHFARNHKWSPFLSVGYSYGFAEKINLINFGGGVNYWFHHRIGLRLEFRDHLYHKDYNSLVSSNWTNSDRNQIAAIRIGLSFR
jgi:hypothetical protein